MPIYKRCNRCRQRLLTGTKCECVKERHKEYKKYRTDKKEQSFYCSGDWLSVKEKVKDRFKEVDIYSYYIKGKIEYGQTSHHIETLKDNWNRRLDIDNLIYLTEQNHQHIHALYNQNNAVKFDTMTLLYELIERYCKEFNIN